MNDTPIRFLLTQLIDYAGLFPPASLGMARAVRNFSEYRSGEQAWILGRFVVPVSRLREFEIMFRDVLPRNEREPWRLSALAGADLAADAEAILGFNGRYRGSALIDTIEMKAALPEEIHEASEILPESCNLFFEIPIDPNLQLLLGVIKLVGAHAKVRTGGVMSDLFPSPSRLAGFMQACRAEMVSFKATAGLHHAIRDTYRLTYDETSRTAAMHGFLNVFLAAAFIFAGMERLEAVQVLEERDARAFGFNDSGVQWHGHHLDTEDLAAARRHLAVAFGSCSLMEPISELQKLNCI